MIIIWSIFYLFPIVFLLRSVWKYSTWIVTFSKLILVPGKLIDQADSVIINILSKTLDVAQNQL